ncbi:ABC transporter permease [Anatilimnocola floriformis]|uniref:ABC transporter permease n=1 Tax=Anatilimnocola floriformis TaxID=2948575 RepID=UPI0020C4DD86|nr:ABC transporter permease [Anatilimnocola floriformis]
MRPFLRWLWRDQAMLLALAALVITLSILTWDRQSVSGSSAGQRLGKQAVARVKRGGAVAIVTRSTAADTAFLEAAAREITKAEIIIAAQSQGEPADALDALRAAKQPIELVIATEIAGTWPAVQKWSERNKPAPVPILTPQPYYFPNFLKSANLLNISNQIAVIAIIAIGMTMVIVTGGVDLSVGSQIALSAVICTLLLRRFGAEGASLVMVLAASLTAISACALLGLISGSFVTLLRVPSFIVTLAVMLLADGLAYNLSAGATINELPTSFMWLGKGTTLGRIPNSAVLMAGLYLLAYFVMTRTVFGRHLYAVGGNQKAAWLCGVPVRGVTIGAFVICGALAGLGGVLMASQLGAGSPNYGSKHELLVIAAVVVGGTSLAGGRGTMWGTFVGALILAVIANGMNLLGLESKRQQIVLGLVILAAVVLDTSKRPKE